MQKRVPNLVTIPCTLSGLVQNIAQNDAQILCRCSGLLQKRVPNLVKIPCTHAGVVRKRAKNNAQVGSVWLGVVPLKWSADAP